MVVNLNKYRKTRKVQKSVEIGIGEWISITRKNQGLTQDRLGQSVGCSQSVISRWETGEVPIGADDLAAVALALNSPDLLKKYCMQCPVAQAMRDITRPKPAA